MYDGYVFFCSKTDIQQCLSNKRYTCASKLKPAEPIKEGAVIFLYNSDDKTLLGPFTALTEGAEELDAGTWAMDIDEHIPSENVKVLWESLHVIREADKQLPFLQEARTCRLGFTQTQRALDLLRQGEPYLEVKEETD